MTQPWGGLVAAGIKRVENRSRRIISAKHFGERFAIHASREIDDRVYDRIAQIAPELAGDIGNLEVPWYRLSRITSAIIGTATCTDIVWDDTGMLQADILRRLGNQWRWWFREQNGHVFAGAAPLTTPVPCKGALGFWTLPDEIEQRVTAQIGGSR